MGRAKDIVIKPIRAKDANRIVKALHYSGKVVNNSKVHFGVFLNSKCGGALQFGPSLDKRKTVGLVEGTLWNEFLELNRMALADWLPRNSESRAISVAMRLLKKHYPWLKWVVSFADACQCGDGTIYRASGFVLIGIKKNNQVWATPDGQRLLSRVTVTKGKHVKENGGASMAAFAQAGWKPKRGFQLRYVYFLDPSARNRLTVPIIPFTEIERRGAGMYKGKPCAGSIDSDAPVVQTGEDGASLIPALQSNLTERI